MEDSHLEAEARSGVALYRMIASCVHPLVSIVRTGPPDRQLTNFTGIVYSKDARSLWLSTHFRSAALYDAKTAEMLLPLPRGAVPLALSANGRFLAASW